MNTENQSSSEEKKEEVKPNETPTKKEEKNEPSQPTEVETEDVKPIIKNQ